MFYAASKINSFYDGAWLQKSDEPTIRKHPEMVLYQLEDPFWLIYGDERPSVFNSQRVIQEFEKILKDWVQFIGHPDFFVYKSFSREMGFRVFVYIDKDCANVVKRESYLLSDMMLKSSNKHFSASLNKTWRLFLEHREKAQQSCIFMGSGRFNPIVETMEELRACA